MVVTEKDFRKLADLYDTIISQFLVLHNVKEVICTDTKEHFFDRIVVGENGSIKVYNHGFTKTTWDRLYFDYTCDYAVCLASMEKDLFMQTRNGKHEKFTFIFNDNYQEPTLITMEEAKSLDRYER